MHGKRATALETTTSPGDGRHTHPTVYIVTALTVIGAVVRLIAIDAKAIWLDEALTYWMSQAGGFGDILAANASGSSAPPLFVYLLAAVSWVGSDEFTLRMLPWAASVVSIPVLWLLAREFVSREGATFAVLLVTVSAAHVKYAQQLREYSLAYLLATLMILFFARFLRTWSLRDLAAFTATSAVGLYTQYGLALLLAAVNLVFIGLAIRDRAVREHWRPWVASCAVCAVAALGVVLVALRHQLSAEGGYGSAHLDQAYGQGTVASWAKLAVMGTLGLVRFADPGCHFGRSADLLRELSLTAPLAFFAAVGIAAVALVLKDRPLWAAGVLALPVPVALALRFAEAGAYHAVAFVFPVFYFALLVAAGIAVVVRRRQHAALALFAVPVVLTWLASCARFYPYHGHRQTMFLVPMFHVLGGVAFGWLWEKTERRAVAVVMAAVFVLTGAVGVRYFLADPGPEQIKPALELLRAESQPGDRVYVFAAATSAFTYYRPDLRESMIVSEATDGDPQHYVPQLDTLLADSGRVWMLFAHDPAHIGQALASELPRRGYHVRTAWQSRDVWLYVANEGGLASE